MYTHGAPCTFISQWFATSQGEAEQISGHNESKNMSGSCSVNLADVTTENTDSDDINVLISTSSEVSDIEAVGTLLSGHDEGSRHESSKSNTNTDKRV